MNKYNVSNYMTKQSGNSVHKMPITRAPEVRNATVRDTGGNRVSGQSDTENVRITKDSVTNAIFGRD